MIAPMFEVPVLEAPQADCNLSASDYIPQRYNKPRFTDDDPFVAPEISEVLAKVEAKMQRQTNELVIMTYHGGRNECFHADPTKIGDWYGYDLAGAYTAGLVHLQQADNQRARPAPGVVCQDATEAGSRHD